MCFRLPLLLLLLPALPIVAGGDEAQGSCPADAMPLVWRAAQKGGREGALYVIGTAHATAAEVGQIPQAVEQALACADIAYFQLACSEKLGGGMGHYMAHCAVYPMRHRGAERMSQRLQASELHGVADAIRSMFRRAPFLCPEVADHVRLVLSELERSGGTLGRTTLRALYWNATRALDTSDCALLANRSVGYEEQLREMFGSERPVFGLQDAGESCHWMRSATVEQDRALAARLMQRFHNMDWIEGNTVEQQAVVHTVRCGDLRTLATFASSRGWIRLLSDEGLTHSNHLLAERVLRALAANPGRSLAVVVDARRLVDLPDIGVTGLLSLLAHEGLKVSQVGGNESLSCESSTYKAPGAKQLGQCLLPPDQQQPSTCHEFGKEWIAELGPNKLHARKDFLHDCAACILGNETCECNVDWHSEEDFAARCEESVVNGTSGQVWDMDLTRNPGSTIASGASVEKTIRSLYQSCYATSCNLNLTRKMALRQWYAHDASLMDGSISLVLRRGRHWRRDDETTDHETTTEPVTNSSTSEPTATTEGEDSGAIFGPDGGDEVPLNSTTTTDDGGANSTTNASDGDWTAVETTPELRGHHLADWLDRFMWPVLVLAILTALLTTCVSCCGHGRCCRGSPKQPKRADEGSEGRHAEEKQTSLPFSYTRAAQLQSPRKATSTVPTVPPAPASWSVGAFMPNAQSGWPSFSSQEPVGTGSGYSGGAPGQAHHPMLHGPSASSFAQRGGSPQNGVVQSWPTSMQQQLPSSQPAVGANPSYNLMMYAFDLRRMVCDAGVEAAQQIHVARPAGAQASQPMPLGSAHAPALRPSRSSFGVAGSGYQPLMQHD